MTMDGETHAPSALAAYDQPRPPVSIDTRQRIAAELAAIPSGRTLAVLGIVDEHGARVHAAVKVGDHWKVGGAFALDGYKRPSGFVGVEYSR